MAAAVRETSAPQLGDNVQMGLPLWMRFLTYGAVGVTFEILFTGTKHFLASRFRDWSLKGRSYIWMIPIYGLAAILFEPAHDTIRLITWPVRGLLYTVGLFIVEFTTGWLLRVDRKSVV